MYKPTLGDIRLRILNRMTGGLAIPWPRYITSVAGAPDVHHYLTSGKDSLHAITDMLVRNGLDMTAPGDVLDFGCGSGRVLRHWARSDGHAPAAIRRRFGTLFDVSDFCPGMPPLRQQDQYLLRKR